MVKLGPAQLVIVLDERDSNHPLLEKVEQKGGLFIIK